MKKIIAILVGLLASQSALALDEGCYDWGCYAKIETLYVSANDYIYVGTPYPESGSTPGYTIPNCQAEAGIYFTLKNSAPNFDRIYSQLLAAQMAKKPIEIHAQANSAGCEIVYTITRG